MGNRMWAVVLRYGLPDETGLEEVVSTREPVLARDKIELTVPQPPKPVVAGRILAVRESVPTVS